MIKIWFYIRVMMESIILKKFQIGKLRERIQNHVKNSLFRRQFNTFA